MRARSGWMEFDRRSRWRWVLVLVVAALVAPLVGVEPVAAATAPKITGIPGSKALLTPGLAVVSASASGDPTPTAEWQRSTDGGATWAAIPGATATSYTATVDASTDFNQYRAVFTNSAGSATTSVATLSLAVAPVITTNPTAITATDGETVTFPLAATGNPTPTVKWQYSTNGGTSWANVTTTAGTRPAYVRVIHWSDSPAPSRPTRTRRAPPPPPVPCSPWTTPVPRMQNQPVSKSLVTGSAFTVSATGRGWPRPTATWQRSDARRHHLGGPLRRHHERHLRTTVNTSYSGTVSPTNDGWQYRAVFTNESEA